MPLTNLQPCFKEEADDRIFLHVNDMVKSGHERVTVITVDTDVVVIALYAFWDLQIKELYIEFGVGKSKQWIPIHEIAAELGKEVCRALLFWYSLSCCDTVCIAISRKRKENRMANMETIPRSNGSFHQLLIT